MKFWGKKADDNVIEGAIHIPASGSSRTQKLCPCGFVLVVRIEGTNGTIDASYLQLSNER